MNPNLYAFKVRIFQSTLPCYATAGHTPVLASFPAKGRTFQVSLVVKNSPTNAEDVRDADSISGLGRSPGGGNGNLLQYSCLEKSMDRGDGWAPVHSVTQSQT